MVDRFQHPEREVTIALVGKYIQLHDAYLSVVEALQHGGIAHRARVRIKWVQADDLASSDTDVDAAFAGVQGILVPGGFGNRGIEGKMVAARYAREHGVPYLGICLGMQMAVMEFARHVCGMEGASLHGVRSRTRPIPSSTSWRSRRASNRQAAPCAWARIAAASRRTASCACALWRGRDLRAPPPPL